MFNFRFEPFFKFDIEIVHLGQSLKNMAVHIYPCSKFQVLTLKGVEDTAQTKKNLIKTICLPLKGHEKQ